ncbi:MAG: hypothetical protein ACKOH7_07730 [Solirubrobacterales bacterium]
MCFQPVAETTRDKAIRRVAGVMIGCLLVGAVTPATTTQIESSPAGRTLAMTIRLYWTS